MESPWMYITRRLYCNEPVGAFMVFKLEKYSITNLSETFRIWMMTDEFQGDGVGDQTNNVY